MTSTAGTAAPEDSQRAPASSPVPLLQGIESEKLRRLVDKLNELGVQRYIELPQIAVMGDTSSGKSSVLTALSGIQFPSSDALTTRCPTQLILSYGKTFYCKARIQRDDARKDMASSSRELSTIDEITNVIKEFTEQLVKEGQEISDDAIVIEAVGPHFPNLTLTDLPGLIRTVKDGEDKSMIGQVRLLVGRYLKQKRTVILAVVPANVDMHNSEILQDANEADTEGDRTLAIITKPDLVDPGAEGNVIKLLNNEAKKLRLGYHAVRCRGQKDLNDNVTLKESLIHEQDFFSSREPWNGVSKSLLGIGTLKGKLVRLLETRVTECLPAVHEDVRSQLESSQERILALGPALRDVYDQRRFYTGKVSQIVALVDAAVRGKYDDRFFDSYTNRLRAVLREEGHKFSEKLRLLCSYKKDKDIKVGDDVEYVDANGTWRAGTLKDFGSTNSCYTVRVFIGDGKVIDKNDVRKIRVSLADIKKKISQCRGEELEIFSSYDVFVRLVNELVVSKWREPAMSLLHFYETAVRKVCMEIVRYVIDVSAHKRLADYVARKMAIFIKDLVKKATERLNELLEIELRPFTLNHYFYDVYDKLRYQPLLKEIEDNSLTSGSYSGYINKDTVMRLLASYGIGSSSNQDREADDLRRAVGAYEKVAKKRFTDDVPNWIDYYLLKSLTNNLSNYLEDVPEDVVSALLAEDSEKVDQRAILQKKVETLRLAESVIVAFAPALP